MVYSAWHSLETFAGLQHLILSSPVQNGQDAASVVLEISRLQPLNQLQHLEISNLPISGKKLTTISCSHFVVSLQVYNFIWDSSRLSFVEKNVYWSWDSILC